MQPKPADVNRDASRLDFERTESDNPIVLARFGNWLMIFALLTAAGGHWAALQTVAWTAMLADNLHSDSLPQALEKTFDGEHPCPICRAIAAGKKSEHKSEFAPQTQKLEYPPLQATALLIGPARFDLLPDVNFFADSPFHTPPTPPPRSFSV